MFLRWKSPVEIPYVDDALLTRWGYTSNEVILVCCIDGVQCIKKGFYSEDYGWMASDSEKPVSVLCWTYIPKRTQYIIAGMAGIGKSTLAKKYPDIVADVESSYYAYDNSGLENLTVEERKGILRPSNPEWPNNYIAAIKEAIDVGFPIVCIQLHPDNYEAYRKAGIPFIVVYPEKEALPEYHERLLNRGNSQAFADKIINIYDDFVLGRCIKECDNEKWILKKGETLEDRFNQLGVLH